MTSVEWEDLYLSPDEYFELMYELAKNSDFFDDMNKKWHPEDLYYNISTVTESAGAAVREYVDVVHKHSLARRQKEYDANKKTVDDMKIQEERVPVFGGT
ncbi:MAG: hypothetical protein EB127_18120, partial [Alphaproteobacteria bacterium]|nr:hypothetical protein [Alphaproteobacteria bacterium]